MLAQGDVEHRAEAFAGDAESVLLDLAAGEQRLLDECLHAGVAIGRASLHQGLGDAHVEPFEAGQLFGRCGVQVQAAIARRRHPWTQATHARGVQRREAPEFAGVGEGQRLAVAPERRRESRGVVRGQAEQGQQALVAGVAEAVATVAQAVEVEACAEVFQADADASALYLEFLGALRPALSEVDASETLLVAQVGQQLLARPGFAAEGQLPELLPGGLVGAADQVEALAGEHVADDQGNQGGDQQHADQGHAALPVSHRRAPGCRVAG